MGEAALALLGGATQGYAQGEKDKVNQEYMNTQKKLLNAQLEHEQKKQAYLAAHPELEARGYGLDDKSELGRILEWIGPGGTGGLGGAGQKQPLGAGVPPSQQSPAFLQSRLPAGTGFSPELNDKIRYWAEYRGLRPDVVAALIKAESGGKETAYNWNKSNSTADHGLGQINDRNLAPYGLTKPYDPNENLRVSTQILKENLDRFGGDYGKAVAAYQMGGGNISKRGTPYGTTYQNVARQIPDLTSPVQQTATPGAAPLSGPQQTALIDQMLPNATPLQKQVFMSVMSKRLPGLFGSKWMPYGEGKLRYNELTGQLEQYLQDPQKHEGVDVEDSEGAVYRQYHPIPRQTVPPEIAGLGSPGQAIAGTPTGGLGTPGQAIGGKGIQKKPPGPKTAEEAKADTYMLNAMTGAKTLRSIAENAEGWDKFVMHLGAKLGGITDEGAIMARSQELITNEILRNQSGAAIGKQEIDKMIGMLMPKVYDSKKVTSWKFDQMENYIESLAKIKDPTGEKARKLHAEAAKNAAEGLQAVQKQYGERVRRRPLDTSGAVKPKTADEYLKPYGLGG